MSTPQATADARQVDLPLDVESGTGRKLPSTLPWRILGYVLFLGAWQYTSTFLVASHILPSPVNIVLEMAEIVTGGDFAVHFGATLQRLVISLPLVLLIGTVVGLAMGLSWWWEAFFRDLVSILLSIPGLTLVLIFILVFGLSPLGPIVAIVVTNFAFVTVQVWEGVKALPKDLTDMASGFRVGRARVLRHIVIPALAPYLFTAGTYAFTLTWKLAMLSELFGSSRGVGVMMRLAFWEFNVTGVVAWALLLFVFALAIERLVLQRLSNRFFRWRMASFN